MRIGPAAPLRLRGRIFNVGCWTLAFIILCTFAFPSRADLYSEAAHALEEGIPQVAIQKLQSYLTGKPSPEQREAAVLKLVQALLAAGEPAEALRQLGEMTGTESDWLRAQIFLALGRWAEALPVCQQLGSSPYATAVKIGEAECLRALGRIPEAIAALESLGAQAGASARLRLADFYLENNQASKAADLLAAFTPDSPGAQKWKQYIDARLSLANGQPAWAAAAFDALRQAPAGLSEGLVAGAVLGLADARLASGNAEGAEQAIEDFIEQHPANPWLGTAFSRLERIYASEKNPSPAELKRWADEPPSLRAGFALLHLACAEARGGRREEALARLSTVKNTYPNHPALGEALVHEGRWLLEDNKSDRALVVLEDAMRRVAANHEQLAEAELLAAAAHFRRRDFVLAASLYRSAAEHSARQWPIAIFNSALAWLRQGNYEQFLDEYKALSARFPESELRRELILEEGLHQARSGDKRAEETLRIFIRDFPEHRRVSDARLALAELAFARNDLHSAGTWLRTALESATDDVAAERGDFLAIFAAEAGKNSGQVIELCTGFIQRRPQSSRLTEVRMKLAQAHFAREDFANAQTQFEIIGRDSASSPYAETALYLAGQCAMRTMNPDRALELFEEAAGLGGPLKLHAREAQAAAKSRQGHEQEAIILFDAILSAKPPPQPQLRWSALCGKGDNLFSLGTRDAKSFEQALLVYEQLATDPGTTAHWRNQALYKKAKCLEKLGRPSEALAACYDVLERAQTVATEYLWSYKAGFDAGRILEEQKQWRPAIALYKKMAALEGPRSDEARTRAARLRLEQFVWEE